MIKTIGKRLIRRMGFDVVRYSGRQPQEAFPPDFDEEAVEIIRAVKPYTLTNKERLFALIQAVRYVVRANIAGSIVECGVWRGGSMMAAALTLKRLAKEDRDLYLFDTYAGMTRPTEVDISYRGQSAFVQFERAKQTGATAAWHCVPLEEVKGNLVNTGYTPERMKFIKGKVEDTLPGSTPQQIALLRLDTDWYESTRHELIHLFPRLAVGGVLIVDDYGYWQGSRKATDEYLAQNNLVMLLNRVDNTGRMAVKP